MCGIAAILSREGPVPERALHRATAALRHRGPDGERTWISPSGRVGLGHTLLAINDPQGTQPIASEDGRLHIIVNGEFYDFPRIRASLERKGHRFRTRSDSEIALHLYEDLGADCLEHLRGQFAFVIWDEETGRLFAARDRFGLKPLFYGEHQGSLYLASEAKALFAAGLPKSWDTRAVYHSLHACPDERRSLFGGISQVPPGHILVAGDGAVRLERYWDLPASPGSRRRFGLRTRNGAPPAPGVEDCVERARELTEESVALRMVAGVPVGCLLSGGLDSSAVLGVAASCTDSPVAAFTVGFERREYDESDGAREMAAATGADHTVLTLPDSALADHFADTVYHAETIQYNTHGAARFSAQPGRSRRGLQVGPRRRGSRRGVFRLRVPARGGKRGPGDRSSGVCCACWDAWPAPRREATPAWPPPHPGWPASPCSSPSLPSLFTRLTRGLGYIHSVCTSDFLHGFQGYDLYRTYYRRCNATARLSQREPSRQLLYLWLHSIFVNYHMAADRLDMAHGVEVRLPFLDHHLFEYVNSLPVATLTAPPQEKLLLRKAMRPYISNAVYERTKRAFMAPSAVGVAGPLHDFLQDTLRGAPMRSVPFIEHADVLRVLDGLGNLLPENRPSIDSLLLMLASVAVLQERYRL